MTNWIDCRYCGSPVADDADEDLRRCCGRDGSCDESLARDITSRAPEFSEADRAVLSVTTDHRALGALMEAFAASGFTDGQLAYAIASIAEPSSFEVMTHLTKEPTTSALFQNGVRYLARLNTPEAREELFRLTEPNQDLKTTIAFASTGDLRATPLLIDWFRRSESAFETLNRHLIEALRTQADPTLLSFLREQLEHYEHTDQRIAEYLDNEEWVDARNAEKLKNAQIGNAHLASLTEQERNYQVTVEGIGIVRHPDPAPLDDYTLDELKRTAAHYLENRHRIVSSIADGVEHLLKTVDVDPLGGDDRKTETTWALRLVEDESNEPVTRFGGQPTWLSTPTWPTFCDRPMQFWGQFEIPWQPDHLAYLFVYLNEQTAVSKEDGSACLFVQPSASSLSVPWINMTEGPVVNFENYAPDDRYMPPRYNRIVSRVASMQPYQRPIGHQPTDEYGHDDWNRIGGSPTCSHGDPSPGPGWRFLFQFSLRQMGQEIGHGEHCYGYVNDAGEGIFLWM